MLANNKMVFVRLTENLFNVTFNFAAKSNQLLQNQSLLGLFIPTFLRGNTKTLTIVRSLLSNIFSITILDSLQSTQ